MTVIKNALSSARAFEGTVAATWKNRVLFMKGRTAKDLLVTSKVELHVEFILTSPALQGENFLEQAIDFLSISTSLWKLRRSLMESLLALL